MPEAVVELVDVRKSFGEKVALDGVSLAVDRGTFVGLVGPNGAGKSTCLRIMQGVLRPSSGVATTFGQPSWPRSSRRNAQIGVQPQQSALFEKLTVKEQVDVFAAIRGVPSRRARETIELLGLGDSLGTRQEKLSGGQRQRLSIACALVGGPELLFLDEPTASLDPVARRELRTLVRSLCDAGTTIVYTSHDLNEVGGLCDVVTVLVDGRVVVSDSPDAISDATGLWTIDITSTRLVGTELQLHERTVACAPHGEETLRAVTSDPAGLQEWVLQQDRDARFVLSKEPFEDIYVRILENAKVVA